MDDLATQLVILACQFLLLGAVLVYELLAPKKNIFALLVVLAILLLVHGQAAWIFTEFFKEGQLELVIGYHPITWVSVKQANATYFWTTCAFVIGWAVLRAPARTYGKHQATRRGFRFGWLGYTLISLWFLATAAALVVRVGGLEAAVTRPGQLIGGQTVLLLAVSVAKWPLLCRLLYCQKVRRMDVLLFSGTLLVILFNSRFLTCFAIMQVLLAIHYCRVEVKLRWLAAMAVPAVLILMAFGVYREFGHRRARLADDPVTVQESKFDTLDWFYRFNVEAFAGVAGIIEQESVMGGLRHDYGLSETAVVLLYIPNSTRSDQGLPFDEWAKTLKGAFPYDRSVVPSGFELSYGHFGAVGMVGYGLLLGLLCSLFNRRARARGVSGIFYLIIGVQLLNGVRASLVGAIMFFGLADLLAFMAVYSLGRWLPRKLRQVVPSASSHSLPLAL